MSDADLIPDLYRIIKNLRSRINALENDQQITGAQNLPDLNDTAIDVFTLADGQTFVYDNNLNAWKNGTAGAGFPIGPYDDGDRTFEIETQEGGGNGWIQASTVDNATNAQSVDVTAAGANEAGWQRIASDGSGHSMDEIADITPTAATWTIDIPNSGSIGLFWDGANTSFHMTADRVNVGTLPTSDPGVSGQLYQVAGVVMVSP